MITRCDGKKIHESGVSDNLRNIFHSFQLTNSEFEMLRKKFGDLCRYEAWQLLRKNLKNNHTDDFDDIQQDLLLAMSKAGIYFKRQTYLAAALDAVSEHVTDPFLVMIVGCLRNLWKNKRLHGASKQTFGQKQEAILAKLIMTVPAEHRPDPRKPLEMCPELAVYCKSITWNQQRALGRQISKNMGFRNGVVSLSEYSHLGSNPRRVSSWT